MIQKALASQVVSGVFPRLSESYHVSNRDLEQYSPLPLMWETALVNKNIALDPRHWVHQRVQAIGWLIHHWVNYLLREYSHSTRTRTWSRSKKVELPLTVLIRPSTGFVSGYWQNRPFQNCRLPSGARVIIQSAPLCYISFFFFLFHFAESDICWNLVRVCGIAFGVGSKVLIL